MEYLGRRNYFGMFIGCFKWKLDHHLWDSCCVQLSYYRSTGYMHSITI